MVSVWMMFLRSVAVLLRIDFVVFSVVVVDFGVVVDFVVVVVVVVFGCTLGMGAFVVVVVVANGSVTGLLKSSKLVTLTVLLETH